MNQQERMLPDLGQWQQQQASPSPRDNEAAVGCGTRYAWAPPHAPATSHAQPGTTQRAWKRGPLLLPITSLATQS